MNCAFIHVIYLFIFVGHGTSSCSSKSKLPPHVKFGKVTNGLTLQVKDPLNYLGYRNFSIFIPSSLQQRKKNTLVFDFHGYYDDAESEAQEDHLHRIAEEHGFVIVYPNAFDDAIYHASDWRSGWNGEGSMGNPGRFGRICHKDHQRYPCFRSCLQKGICSLLHPSRPNDCHCSSCVDDVEYIRILYQWLSNHLCIDETQIHGTAISMGAIFLYYLTTLSTKKIGFRFNSIVPVAGSFYFGHLKPPTHPVAVLDLHGISDDTVPMNASFSIGRFLNRCPVKGTTRLGCAVGDDLWYYHNKEDILPTFAQANGCHPYTKHRKTTPKFDG